MFGGVSTHISTPTHPTARATLRLLRDARRSDGVSTRWASRWVDGPTSAESARLMALQGDKQAPCQTALTHDGQLMMTKHHGDNVTCGVPPGGLIIISGPGEGCQIVCTKRICLSLTLPTDLAARAADGDVNEAERLCWAGLLSEEEVRHSAASPAN